MSTCIFHPDSPACPEADGFETPFCHDCWWRQGCPTQQPAILADVRVSSPEFRRVEHVRTKVAFRIRHLMCGAAMHPRDGHA